MTTCTSIKAVARHCPREKNRRAMAAMSFCFVLLDESKLVKGIRRLSILPVEIIPMARGHVAT